MTASFIIFIPGQGSGDRKNDNIFEKEFNMSFQDAVVSFDGNWSVVSIPGTDNPPAITGQPRLPKTSFKTTIPVGMRVTGVEVIPEQSESIKLGKPVRPSQALLPTLLDPEASSDFVAAEDREMVLDESVYAGTAAFPLQIVETWQEEKAAGERILEVSISPIQYVPSRSELLFHKKLRVKVTFSKDEMPLQAGAAALYGTDKASVPNYCSGLFSWHLNESPLDYVIITSSDLAYAFEPLAFWKTSKGVPSGIVLVSNITSSSELNCTGVDTQEKIRNFIKDCNSVWSVNYVLLGGDNDIVPSRGGYGRVSGIPKDYLDNTIPADLYYSDLDGNWNADGDSIYGEVSDNVNLYPDVFVGRASVDTYNEAGVFVNKTLTYEKTPSAGYLSKALMAAEYLDSITDGGITKDSIISASIPQDFAVTKLYERFGNESASSFSTQFNNHQGLVNHVGHANQNALGMGFSSFYSSNADALNNGPAYSVMYSMGCDAADFTYSESIAEHFLNDQNGGAMAFVGNSRYGWYDAGQAGDGPSDLYDESFFNAIFDSGLENIGRIFAESKANFITDSRHDGNAMRWIQYALNLLGDPETPLWTDEPRHISLQADSTIKGTAGTRFTLTVINGSINPLAGAAVTLLQPNGSVYVMEQNTTDSSGNASFLVDDFSDGKILVTVTKYNFIPNQTNITADASPPTVEIFTPQNIAYNVTAINLTYYTTDAVSGVNSVWYEYNGTNNTLTANTTFVAIADATSTLTVWANDTAGNTASTQVTFTIDTTPPIVNIIYPKNQSYATTNISLNYYISDFGAGIDKTWYEYNGTNNTLTANTTFVAIADATSTLTVWANDTLGNTTSTTVTFTTDTTPPIVNIIYPKNQSYATTNISLNYYVLDLGAGINTVWYEYNGINNTLTTNTTFTALADTTSTLILWANDSAGNANSNGVTFTVDTAPPIITIQSPLNQTYNTASVWANATLSEDGNCDRSFDGGTNASMTNPSTGSFNNFTDGLSEGLHNITFFCNDSMGNNAESNITYFTVEFIHVSNAILHSQDDSGGGGSAPLPSGSPESMLFSRVNAGETIYFPPSDWTNITNVTLTPLVDVQNLRIRVQQLPENASTNATSEPGGQIYFYVHVSVTGITASGIRNASFSFKVSKAWLSENGLDAVDVRVKRYDAEAGTWNDVPIELVNEDVDYYYFNVTLNHFSLFVITTAASAIKGGVTELLCGDGFCSVTESCSSCPSDCGTCPSLLIAVSKCGDGSCSASENCTNCPSDCGTCALVCGDGICGTEESRLNCPEDCGARPAICGNSVCDEAETAESCPHDCIVAITEMTDIPELQNSSSLWIYLPIAAIAFLLSDFVAVFMVKRILIKRKAPSHPKHRQ